MSSTTKEIQEWQQTLAADPHNRDAFDALEENLVLSKRWRELVRLFETQTVLSQELENYWPRLIDNLEQMILPQLEEVPERSNVMMQIGLVWEDRVGRKNKAMLAYQKAFKTWPYNTEALDKARSIYAQDENWKLVLKLYQLELQVMKEKDRQAAIFREMADIRAGKMGDVEAGVELLQRAMKLDPDNAETAALLRRYTTTRADWEVKLEELGQQLGATNAPRARSQLHLEIAKILLEHDPENDAVERELALAVEHDPRNGEASDLLANLLRDAERWEDLAALLESRAEDKKGRKEEVQAALAELAELKLTHLDDESGAMEAFEQVLELDPTNPAALRSAQAFYERNEDWPSLIKLYESALRLKRRQPGELELQLEFGEMLWKKVGDLDAADKQYRRVKITDSKNPQMLSFYQHYYRSRGDWRKLYSTLNTLRQAADDPAREAEILVEMAEVAQEHMNSPEKAIDAWKSILKLDGEDARAREELHALFEKTGKWNALLEFYKEEIQILEESGDSPELTEAKVALHLKMVEIYRDRLRLDVMVINTYNAILQIDPVNEAAIDALAERYEASKRWNDLIGVLQRKADVLLDEDPEKAIPLLHQVAELWKGRLGNTSQAIPVLERILELDTEDAQAIAELKKIYEHRRDWTALLSVLEKETALLEGKPLAQHLAKMAEMARRRMKDPEQARALNERVLDALEGGDAIGDVPLYRKTLGELEKLYDDEGDTEALIRVLERSLRIAEKDRDRIKVLQRLAELVHESGGEAERAVELWRQILAIDPNQTAALDQLTGFYVENGRWNDMEALYGGRGEWSRLFEILDSGATMVSSSDDQIALYERMARIAREQLDDSEKVMMSLESILELRPTDVSVASQLLPYYREAGESSKEIQANLIVLENDGGDPFELTCEIARLHREAQGDLEQAFDWEERAFRMRPGDAELRARLEQVARQVEQPGGRLAEMVNSYRDVAEEVDDPALRLTLYRTVARTAFQDLEWFEDAVQYYERILAEEPEDSEAIDALHVLYDTLERWEKLLDIMERKVQLVDLDENKGGAIALHFEIAELLKGALGRRLDAVDSYRTVLDLEPTNLDAVRGLKAIFQQEEDWGRMAEAIEQELGLLQQAGEEAEARSLTLQLGNVYEHQLSDPHQAVSWYARLLGAPSEARAPAVSALEGLLRLEQESQPEQAVRIAALLEPVHREDANHARLAEMLEIRLSAMDEPVQQRATLWELATLYEQEIGEPGKAFGALRRLLAIANDDRKVWDELERLAGAGGEGDAAGGRWPEVATLYSEITPSRDELGADAWAFELLRRLARVYEQELGDDAQAREAYETLLLRDSADMLTITSLEEVYSRLEAWPELVDLLERKSQLVETAEERKAVLFRVASIHEGEAAYQPDEAIGTYRRILLDDPRDGAATERLEALLAREGRWRDLVDQLSSRMDLAEDEAARLPIMFQLGQVLERELDDLAGAVDTYRQILAVDAGHADALGAMERLSAELNAQEGDLELRRIIDETLEPIYTEASAWDKLVHVLGLKLGYTDLEAEQAELHIRIGRLHRDRLEQPGVAFEHLRQAVALRFDDAALRAEFEALADGTERHGDAVLLYEELLVSSPVAHDGLRAEVLERVAELQERRLGNVPAAIDAWVRLMEIDPAAATVLDNLERLYEAEGQWQELVEICQRKADLADGEARVAVMHKVGGLYQEKLEDPFSAIDTFRRILDISEGDAAALDALEGLYAGQQQWVELVEILQRKVAQAEEPGRKRELLQQVADIHENNLHDPHEAIATFRRVLDLFPEDQGALDALDRLYLDQGQHEQLAAILERKLEIESDAGRQGDLRMRLGQVQQLELGMVTEAIATYGQILDAQPEDERARDALRGLLLEPEHRYGASKVLEPRYRAESSWSALVDLLEIQLEDTEERDARLGLLDEIATLQEGSLEAPTMAFDAVRRAYRLDPMATQRVEAMERLAEETGEYDELVQVYEEVLPEVADGAERLRVLLKVAAVYRDHLDDAARSEDAYNRALMEDPSCLEALEALERLLERQERWNDLLRVLEDKVQVLKGAGREEEAQAMLFALATTYDERLMDPVGAITTFLRVLDQDPSNQDAISALKRLYRSEGQWFELTELLHSEIGMAEGDPERVVALRYELAQVYQRQLMDAEQAAKVYRSILAQAPDHEETIASLEEMFADRIEAQAVAELLEPIYWRRERWEPLTEVLEVRRDARREPEWREALLTQMARIHEEKLGNAEAASEVYQRLAVENPLEAGVWSQLERLAEDLGNWAQVADTYSEVLLHSPKIEDDATRLSLTLGRARVLDHRLDDIDAARQVYREALVYDELQPEALDALERIATRQREWMDLVALYQRQAELADDDAVSQRMQFKIATLYEEVLLDPDSAIDAYRQALELKPDDEVAVKSLERLYRAEERWIDLADLYRREADRAESPEASIAMRHERALVLFSKLDEPSEAIGIFRQILAEAPGYAPARRSLETMLHELAGHGGVFDDELRLQIALMLQPLYNEETEWRKLIEVNRVQLEAIQDHTEKARVLRRIAELHETREGNREAAFDAYARAFAEDVDSEELRGHLERLAAELVAWQRLVDIYLDAQHQTVNTRRQVQLLHRVAELRLEKLSDRDGAIDAYRDVLIIDDRDRAAVQRLEALYREGAQWEELVEILEVRADLAEDELDRKEIFYQIAELWESELSDDDRAIETYQQILGQDESDLAAMEALERLYRRIASWDQLIVTLGMKVDLMETPEDKIPVYRAMAEVFEKEQENIPEAISTYRTIRSLDATDRGAVQSLDRLYVRDQAWGELLDILTVERDFAEEDGPEAVSAVEFRMGQLLEEHLYDVVRAIEVYRRIAERTPDHLPAVESLEHLMDQPEHREQAFAVLRPLYEGRGEWRKLVKALETVQADAYDPETKREQLQTIANIQENRLDNPMMAFVKYGEAFAASPEHEEPRANLERLAADMDNYTDLVATYEEKLVDIYDVDLVRDLNLRLGQIYEDKLGDQATAIERYERVAEADAYNAPALESLDRLYQQTGQWHELSEVLERKSQTADTPEEGLELKFRLATLLEDQFQEYDRALAVHREILAASETHAGSLAALDRMVRMPDYTLEVADQLEPLHREAGRWEKLVELYGLKRAQIDNPAEQAWLWRRAAEVYADQLEQPQAAFDALGESLLLDSVEPEAFERYEALAAELGAWEQAATLYEELSEVNDDPIARQELLSKVARWYRDKLNSPDRAEGCYRKVLEADPENMEAMTALVAIYEELGDHRALYDALSRKADVTYELPERKALYNKMALLAIGELGDTELAIDAYEKLRATDDTDKQALEQLATLYDSTQQYHEQIEALRRLAELAESDERRVELWRQVGAIQHNQLDQPEEAIEAYRYALDHSPGHQPTLEVLEGLYRQTENWFSLQEILVQQLTHAESDEARVELSFKAARLAEEQFEDVDGALEHYRQILASSPGHPGALAEMERLYTRTERWYDLKEILIQQLDAAEDPAEQVRLHVAISDVAAQHLYEPETAKEHLQAVLEADPNNLDALGVLGKLYQADGEWEQAMSILERQIEHCGDEARMAELLLQKGRAFEEHFDDLAKAEENYRAAMEFDSSNDAVLQALKALHRKTKNWEALVHLMRIEAQNLTEDSDRIALYLEMADIASNQVGDAASAVEALEAAYALDSDNLEIAEPLLQAYIDADEATKAEPILEGIIEALTAKRKFRQLFKFHHLRGQLAEQRGDAAAALESYQAAYDLDATYIPNLLSLGRLYFEAEDWDKALKVYQTLLLHQMKIKDKKQKLEVYFHLGHVRLAKGDTRRAKDMFTRALGVDRDHAPSKEALSNL